MQITLRILGYHFSSRLTATLNICLFYFKITWELAILLEHMHRKFEINRTKIKAGCQSGRKMVTHNCKSDLPLPNIFCYFRLWYVIKIVTDEKGQNLVLCTGTYLLICVALARCALYNLQSITHRPIYIHWRTNVCTMLTNYL